MGNRISLGSLIWIIIGVVVAISHGYPINNLSSLVSFVLALLLWPLVLLGIDLHVMIGA